jgi:preprotein translocase subunit Sec61beta
MAKNDKINMPSGIGGLVRYFDEYKSKIVFKPGTVLVIVFIIIVFMALLHNFGAQWFGI